jgi:hypothetical protein
MFFGTESLGHIGQPIPLAQAAGVLPVALWIALAQGFGRSKGHASEKGDGIYASLSC